MPGLLRLQRSVWVVCLVGVAWAMTAGAAVADEAVLAMAKPNGLLPKPAIAPRSWELNFRYQDPQRVAVLVPGEAQPRVYWYMLYRVENKSEREQNFFPQFEMVTDTMQVVPSEVSVSPEAFNAIRRRSGNPLLVAPEKAMGLLLRGEDQARHSVAIWPDFDPQAKSFTVYVRGLSGEFARMANPVFDPELPDDAANPRFFTLYKTLAIPYRLPASLATRGIAVPSRQQDDQRWVMR